MKSRYSLLAMIGPHEGRELELLMDGSKKLAVFHDAIPPDGVIAEEIIPEKRFAPYVASGQLVRTCEDIECPKLGCVIRTVCFTPPDQSWRADAFLQICRDTYGGKRESDEADDIRRGRLLGYSEDDIEYFLRHSRELRLSRTRGA